MGQSCLLLTRFLGTLVPGIFGYPRSVSVSGRSLRPFSEPIFVASVPGMVKTGSEVSGCTRKTGSESVSLRRERSSSSSSLGRVPAPCSKKVSKK